MVERIEWTPKDSNTNLRNKARKDHTFLCNKRSIDSFQKALNDKSWEIYDFPIQEIQGDSLYVVAHRIGYEQSDVLKSKSGI